MLNVNHAKFYGFRCGGPASVINIQEFYADSLGQEFCRALSNALNPDIMRRTVMI